MFLLLLFITILLLFSNCYVHVEAKVAQCHEDCRSPLATRPVGPTRPWHLKDDLGNTLELTKPYPFSIAGILVSVVKFNVTMTITNENRMSLASFQPPQFDSFVLSEKQLFKSKIMTSIFKANYDSFRVRIIDYPQEYTTFDSSSNNGTRYDLQFVAQININAEHNGFNRSTAKLLFSDDMKRILVKELQSSPYNDDWEREDYRQVLNRTFTFSQESSIEVVDDLIVVHPNPYTAFCEIGCSLFYSFPTEIPVELVHCTDQCDEMYRYNISVGYNDLAEVARLECRDGCQIALKRCQPGYYCSQVKLNKTPSITSAIVSKQSENVYYEGGIMKPCPVGTYRDVDYGSVETCVPCPPGRFREDTKGRNLDSCSKCPVGTYNKLNGSSSILDCLRCPAGTFTNQPGSEFCLCITPAACANDQLPSPADAEKRDTIPYIGRW